MLADFTAAMARRCLQALPREVVYLDGYLVCFADATQLEVEGNCFDAAEVDYKGAKAFQWARLLTEALAVRSGELLIPPLAGPL